MALVSDVVWHRLLIIMWSAVMAAVLCPASFWLSVEHMRVHDTVLGEPIILDVHRSINRPFIASWSVRVRQVVDDSDTIVCMANGSGEYRRSAKLPDPLTLDWWTDGKCGGEEFPAGRYIVSTMWTIESAYLPRKYVYVESNVFSIAP